MIIVNLVSILIIILVLPTFLMATGLDARLPGENYDYCPGGGSYKCHGILLENNCLGIRTGDCCLDCFVPDISSNPKNLYPIVVIEAFFKEENYSVLVLRNIGKKIVKINPVIEIQFERLNPVGGGWIDKQVFNGNGSKCFGELKPDDSCIIEIKEFSFPEVSFPETDRTVRLNITFDKIQKDNIATNYRFSCKINRDETYCS